MTTQRWSRSRVGPPHPRGQGRLQEHQPKLKCLFILSRWLCSCPVPSPPSAPAHLWRAQPAAPGEDQRRQEAVRGEEQLPPRVSRPSDPTCTPPTDRRRTPPGRCTERVVLVSVRARAAWTRASPPAYTWFQTGHHGEAGNPAAGWSVLGCEHLTPRPVPERRRAAQTGPAPARMAFASSQRSPPPHTPPTWGHPLRALAGVACVDRWQVESL